MDVKEIVARAKQYIIELFADQGLINLGLEEVDYDDAKDQWHITIGFSRDWGGGGQYALLGAAGLPRIYKVVIVDKSGRPLSVKDRFNASAA
jgi:hypothetical protein